HDAELARRVHAVIGERVVVELLRIGHGGVASFPAASERIGDRSAGSGGFTRFFLLSAARTAKEARPRGRAPCGGRMAARLKLGEVMPAGASGRLSRTRWANGAVEKT